MKRRLSGNGSRAYFITCILLILSLVSTLLPHDVLAEAYHQGLDLIAQEIESRIEPAPSTLPEDTATAADPSQTTSEEPAVPSPALDWISAAWPDVDQVLTAPLAEPTAPAQKTTVVAKPDQDTELFSPSRKISLKIPKGAVSTSTEIELTELSAGGATGRKILNLFDLTAKEESTGQAVTTFSKALTISIAHKAADLSGLDTDTLKLYYLDEKSRQWLPIDTSNYDKSQRKLTADVTHFTEYGEQADPLVNGPGRVMAADVNLHSGASVFSYPFELPPGPGGFKPKLELSYSSASVDETKNKRATGSWAGLGWSLHLGRISYNFDTGLYNLDLNEGSYQLVSTDGASYRTNPEQYFKITRSGNTWELLDREGVYYRFGGTTDSEQYEFQDETRIYYRWDLSLIRDTNGNEATVSYLRDIKGTAPSDWVRSAYPEYLKYSNNLVEVHFSSSADENDPTDGLLRKDNPKTYGSNPAPKAMENRKLDAIEIKVSGSLIRQYNFAYTTTDRVYSTNYGGIYYSGKHSLASITQKGADGTLALPSLTFTYQDKEVFRWANPGSTYYGNPGQPASIYWPYLTAVNSGYGGSISFAYTQKPPTSTFNAWTRQILTSKTVNGGIGPAASYTYAYGPSGDPDPKYVGNGWDQEYRGYGEVKETDAAGNYVKHYYYTSGTLDGKDAEKLTGREYKTHWYSSSGALLQEKKYDYSDYTTGQTYDFINRWSSDGAGGGLAEGLFQLSYGIAVSSDGYVYVTGYDQASTYAQVNKFDRHGNFVLKWGSYGSSSAYQFILPRGLAVDAQGNVYVVDSGNNRIKKFSSSGTYILGWGSAGSGNGQFNNPYGVELDSQGNVYVADTGNNRIQKFSSSGTYLTQWGGTGTGEAQFDSPRDVALDGQDNVYVADANNNRIQKFTSGGSFITKWGTAGSGDGQFSGAVNVDVDDQNNVYVADDGNKRIQKFSSSGTYLFKWTQQTAPSALAVAAQSLYRAGASGNAYAVTEYIYNWAVRLAQVDEITGSKTGRTRFLYDDYGNIVTRYSDGDISTNSDDATLHRLFYPNTTANILNQPARERVYATITGDVGGSNLKKETFYYYDGANTSYTTPPVKGNLTRLEQKKDASNSVSGYYTYDSYGNKLTNQDPNGNTTTSTYDTTYHTYPLTKTYPVTGLAESYTYDTGTSNVLTGTDVNGQTTSYEYDTFKRLIKTIKPGDSSGSPSLEYQYNSWGTLNSQHVRVETKVAEGDNLWQSDYFDGLGRVVQRQARGETGRTIIASTNAFNNRGLVDKRYVSQDLDSSQVNGYKAPETSWKYASYVYDGLGRLSRQTNADGAWVTHDFTTAWQDTVVNERGYTRDYLFDAFGRLFQVKEYDGAAALNYSYLTKWGSSGSGDGQFIGLSGIAVDAEANIYVADPGNNRVQKFTSSGVFLTKWGTSGSGDGQFNYPRDLAIDAQGNVYVVDRDNNRIQKFTSGGTFVAKWGSFGTGDGQFRSPQGIAVDGQGNVYVTDTNNRRIQKFTSGGTFITKWGSYGSGDGQFNNPQGLGVDGQSNVYVADQGNNRVQEFTSGGVFLTKWGSYGFGDGQFQVGPQDVATDSQGNVYAVDDRNDRIQKFTSSGTFITKWGSAGSGDGQFNGVKGVALDADNYVYACESGNPRVQKFSGVYNPVAYATTTYSYDVLGNLTQTLDNASNTISMSYDWLSRKTAMTDPDMGSWSYGYDSNGNLTSQTDAKSQTITLAYDALNRLTGKSYPQGSGMTDVAYTYDDTTGGNFGKGRRTSMSDALGATAYKYDNRGRLTEEKRTVDAADYTTGFAYDGASRITSVTYPSGETVTNGYNGRGLPYGLSGSVSGNLVNSAFYNQLGQLIELNLGNSLKTSFGYWGFSGTYDNPGGYYGRLWRINTSKQPGDSPVLQDSRFIWDAGGNLRQRQDAQAAETETFSHDFLDRLTQTSGPYSESYAYDPLGNITSKNGNSYTYSTKPHAVTQVGSTTYAYDANGNMTTRGSQTLTWNVENKLLTVTGGANFVYDGDGKRGKKTEGGQTVLYVNKYYEKNLTTSEATSHYYLGSKQIAMRKGSSLTYIQQDHLGGTTVVSDASGASVGTIKYFPFGDTRSSSGTLPDQKFTGQRLDSTGLYYYGARYYDATIGRFISSDTFVQWSTGISVVSYPLTTNAIPTGLGTIKAPQGNFPKATLQGPRYPQNLNRFSYVINNPLLYTDPYGWWEIGLGVDFAIGVGGGITGNASIAFDGHGGIAVSISGGGGGYAGAGAGVSVQAHYTSAEIVEDLEGVSVQTGGSVTIGVPTVGLEWVAAQTYQGVTLGIGLSTPVPIEFHSFLTYADIFTLVSPEVGIVSNPYDTPVDVGGGFTAWGENEWGVEVISINDPDTYSEEDWFEGP